MQLSTKQDKEITAFVKGETTADVFVKFCWIFYEWGLNSLLSYFIYKGLATAK